MSLVAFIRAAGPRGRAVHDAPLEETGTVAGGPTASGAGGGAEGAPSRGEASGGQGSGSSKSGGWTRTSSESASGRLELLEGPPGADPGPFAPVPVAPAPGRGARGRRRWGPRGGAEELLAARLGGLGRGARHARPLAAAPPGTRTADELNADPAASAEKEKPRAAPPALHAETISLSSAPGSRSGSVSGAAAPGPASSKYLVKEGGASDGEGGAASERAAREKARANRRRSSHLEPAELERLRRESWLQARANALKTARASDDDAPSQPGWLEHALRHPWLHPDSDARQAWNGLVGFLILYSVVLVPFNVGFDWFEHRPPGLVAFDVLVDFLFLLDVVSQFFLPFRVPTARNSIERRLPRIALAYARTWFLLELVSSIPTDLLTPSMSASSSFALRLLKTARILKLARISRIRRIIEQMQRNRSVARLEAALQIYPGTGRLLSLIFWMGLSGHWICCLQFYAAAYDGSFDPNSWVVQRSLEAAPAGAQYLEALYWVLTTICTIGYGDIVPGTARERVLTLFMFLFGATLFAFIIGSITSLATSLDKAAALYRERMSAVASYMRYARLPEDLRLRIRGYYDHALRGPLAFDERAILGDLSPALRTEVARFVHKDILMKAPIFRNVSDTRFLDRIVVLMNRRIFGPGDAIFYEGERGSDMFFIASGTVRIALGPEHREVALLRAGDFFGE
eukprot:tig00001056_g6621.t1